MENITQLFKQDFSTLILGIFIIMAGIITMFEIIGKFSVIIGKPVKWVKTRQEDHNLLIQTTKGLEELRVQHEESVNQSIRHDQMIKDDISKLSDTINGIAETLSDMQEKDNITELKKLKDSLIRYYNKYKDNGEWSKLEKDAFWDLFDEYEKRGGDGYIHSIVEPVMRELKEID